MIYAMENKLSRLIQRCSQVNTVVLLLFGFVAQLMIMIIAAVLWKEKMSGYVSSGSLIYEFTMVVILVPLFETLIFQYAIIDYTMTRFKSAPLAMLISAAAFGLTHIYTPHYILATFVSGLLFAFLYLVFRIKNHKPFLYVLILHSGYNLFVWLIRMFFT